MSKLSDITTRQKIIVMIGAMLALFLAALDQTIVSTAMPKIIEELNGFDKLTWVFTAYMLASTIIVPVYGKLSDIYGRRIFFLLGIVVFLIGSALSGISQNMTQLIIFRAIQGLGAGAILANSFAIIGDLFPPSERGRWQGIFGSAWGLASVVGPTLGGYLTDHASWRWNFYINIPVGILAFAFIFFLMPKVKHEVLDKSIDYPGAIALSVALVSLLLGFVWGGNVYAWASIQVIGIFLLSFISFCTFAAIEHKSQNPILPLTLFQNSIFTLSMIIVFIVGAGMFGAIIFIPLFAQSVLGISATNSGAILTPLVLGIVIASFISGQLVSKIGKYKSLTIFGLEVMTLGIFLLSQMNTHTSGLTLALFMVITGAGLGVTFPIFNIVVQNAFEQSKLGVVTAATQLFRSVGATIGIAVMGSIVNNALANKLSTISSDPFVQTMTKYNPKLSLANLNSNQLQNLLSPSGIGQVKSQIVKLPPQSQREIFQALAQFANRLKEALSSAIVEVFALGSIIMLIAIALSFFLKEIKLKDTHDQEFSFNQEEEQVPVQSNTNKKVNLATAH